MDLNFYQIGKKLKRLREEEDMTPFEASILAFPEMLYCEDPEGIILDAEAGRIHSTSIIITLANFFWVPLSYLTDNNGTRDAGKVSGKRNMTFFSSNLRGVMKQQRITCHELAIHASISESSIRSYRSGRRSPTLKNLLVIAKVLGVSIDALLEPTGDF